MGDWRSLSIAEWNAILSTLTNSVQKNATGYNTSAPPPSLDVLEHQGLATIPGWHEPEQPFTLGDSVIMGNSALFPQGG